MIKQILRLAAPLTLLLTGGCFNSEDNYYKDFGDFQRKNPTLPVHLPGYGDALLRDLDGDTGVDMVAPADYGSRDRSVRPVFLFPASQNLAGLKINERDIRSMDNSMRVTASDAMRAIEALAFSIDEIRKREGAQTQ